MTNLAWEEGMGMRSTGSERLGEFSDRGPEGVVEICFLPQGFLMKYFTC